MIGDYSIDNLNSNNCILVETSESINDSTYFLELHKETFMEDQTTIYSAMFVAVISSDVNSEQSVNLTENNVHKIVIAMNFIAKKSSNIMTR